VEQRLEIMTLPTLSPVRDLHRWLLAAIMLGTILFGWKYPVLGFTVPAAMVIGMGGGLLRGRYVCGNICPRGSFYDTLFRYFGGTRPVPALFSSMKFRWGVMTVLMSLMGLQIAQNPGDPLHWGRVFWLVCAVTTGVGVLLGTIYRARTWCTFCPVGTMANALGGSKDQLQISHDCRECGRCEKQCPMDLSIVSHKAAGTLPHRDCLKCSSCKDACPTGALSWPSETA
jgi:polyferredoxin